MGPRFRGDDDPLWRLLHNAARQAGDCFASLAMTFASLAMTGGNRRGENRQDPHNAWTPTGSGGIDGVLHKKREATMPDLNAALLRQVASQAPPGKASAQAAIIAAVGPVLAAALAECGIDPPLRAAHFLAQTCLESDRSCTTVEYGDDEYFAKYDGRKDLGNNQPGDGARFRGRGLIQITGRANYRAMGTKLGLDLVDNPTQAADPATSLRIACAFWNVAQPERLCRPGRCAGDDLEGERRVQRAGLTGRPHWSGPRRRWASPVHRPSWKDPRCN